MTAPANHELQHDPDDMIFMRKRAQRFNWRAFVTLRNIVIAAGLVAFLVVLASVASPRVAVMGAAMLGIVAFIAIEMSARRRWERDIVIELQRMGGDFDRIVREVARNRNDLADVRRMLADAGQMARSFGRDVPAATADTGGIEQRMIKAIAEQLSRMDAPQRGLATGEMDEPEIQLPVIEGLTVDNAARILTDEQVMLFVQHAVQQDSIDLFLQPIVNLPQRKPRFFEMLSRIRISGEIYLPAGRYIAVAMKHDMVPVIDNLLLLRALQFIRDAGDDGAAGRAWFCNITSLTLNDPKFMGDLVEFIAAYRTLAPRLVFEFNQQDLATMRAESLPVLDGLSRLGCRFSMDRVRELSFDFAHLEARHVRFVKVEAALIIAEMKEIGGLKRVQRLKAELDSRGIDLIVEKIESERQLVQLLDIEIDYGQGYLFGKPTRDALMTPES